MKRPAKRPISDRVYRSREIQTALAHCPRLYPCAKCGSPVVDGLVCGWCGDDGDDDPSCDPSGKLSREDVKDATR